MATLARGSPIGKTIEQSQSTENDRDMNMEEAGETDGSAGNASGGRTSVTTTTTPTRKPQEHNGNGKRLRSETPEASSAPGDWRSRMERTIWQKVDEMAQLNRTVEKLAKMIEAHAACEGARWLGMRTWMDDREKKWDECHDDDVVWGMGITGIPTKVMEKAAAAPRQKDDGAVRQITAESRTSQLQVLQHAITAPRAVLDRSGGEKEKEKREKERSDQKTEGAVESKSEGKNECAELSEVHRREEKAYI